MLRLIPLSLDNVQKQYEYISAVPEDENSFANAYYGAPRENFESVLQNRIDHSSGKSLPEGYVPETHYLLWDGDDIVGWFRLRHHLCPSLVEGAGHIGYSIREVCRGNGYATEGLRQLIEKAAHIIPEDEIDLRVDKDNPASLRVMLKNGGYIHHEDGSKIYVRIDKRKAL